MFPRTCKTKKGIQVKTRNGIIYDLNESDYRHTENGLTFVFSSQLYLDKFINKIQENRKYINNSLSKRFDVKVDVSALADVVLYGKIEKRGYLIVTNEDFNIFRRNNILFVGDNVTLMSFNEQ